MKTCPKCKTAKPLSEFHANKKMRDGRAWSCKQCVKEMQHGLRDRDISAYKAKNKANNVRRTLGLTVAEYDALVAKGCAVCQSQDKVGVDHCHQTGAVRSALCSNCNVALGMVSDSPHRLRALASYLEDHAA